ncbi:hypothetical protein I9W82_003317 [Candida metapsilosis]|uniref:DUF3533 domain-containing protein n=1 Tax=Candida metapsilosis TaxID=273372 RepID=A0A8H7ZG83_9ASCO|nr:hypothetical protein I9W82_003317 [Candida metapsilosis]
MSTSNSESVDPLEKQGQEPPQDVAEDANETSPPSGGFTGEALAKEQSVRRESTKPRQSVTSIKLTFQERMNEYIRATPKFIWAYVQVFCIYVGFLSLYWGTLYRRQDRFQNVDMLVVNDDTPFTSNGSQVQPYISNAFINLLQEPEMRSLGNFKIANITEFRELADSRNNTLYEEVV